MKKVLFFVATTAIISACSVSRENGTDNSTSGKLSTIDVANMSKSVKAQEDFFLFANETWIKKNPVPPSESRWGSFNELEKSNMEKLTSILTACADDKNASKGSTEQLLGAYYASFINMEQRNKSNYEAVTIKLKKINQMTDVNQLADYLPEMHIEGIGSFFGFGVGQDLKNVDFNISYLSQGGLGLPNKDYYLNENKAKLLDEYVLYVSEMARLFGLNDVEAKEMAKNIQFIETRMAESMMGPAEMRIPEKTYNKMSIDQATEMFGSFDFKGYLKRIGSQPFDSLIVSNPEYIQNLGLLFNEVDLRVIQNYLSWKVMNHYSGHMSQAHVQKRFDFYGKKLSGKSEMKPVHENAIEEITRSEFGELLGKKFVEKHFSAEAQRKVNEMVDNLLIVFRERINNLDWMSGQTKQEALTKLNAIGRKLGYPDKWEDFSALNFTSSDYLNNYIEAQRFSHYKNLNKLNQPVDKQEWGMPAHMVNAYYHPLLNEIAFPAGIMQAPFFDEKAEDAVNYGRIGMVIGHEFTHGFDDMGSKFAADGTFKNWWSESDRKLFEEKTTILGETFSSFCPIEGHCVNPDLTMGENIADLGGLTMAYYAYLRTEEYTKNEIREGFNPAQRFFIAYAQLWKINYTEEEMKNRIATDPHSPGMYRVNGPLMNCPEFFEVFDVKEGDKMRNPKTKVAKIW